MKSLETKKEIRARLKKDRASLPAEMRQAFSDRIFKAVIGHPLYQNAEEIYCYVAFGEEVSTLRLVEYSWKMGKKVAVPKIHVDNSGLRMEFYYIDSMDELSEGYYGISEPPAEKMASGSQVLVIMPGVAFDRRGSPLVAEKAFMTLILESIPNTAA